MILGGAAMRRGGIGGLQAQKTRRGGRGDWNDVSEDRVHYHVPCLLQPGLGLEQYLQVI